jgi:hypothetical protein
MKIGRKELGLLVLAIAVAVGGYVALDQWVLDHGLPAHDGADKFEAKTVFKSRGASLYTRLRYKLAMITPS